MDAIFHAKRLPQIAFSGPPLVSTAMEKAAKYGDSILPAVSSTETARPRPAAIQRILFLMTKF
jgi:hypothetical protein